MAGHAFHDGKRKMRAFARTIVGRLPMVRGLLDQRDAPSAGRNTARTEPDGADPSAYGRVERDLWRVEHTKAATYEDIFYCFRLLLGRSPNSEEWPGHSSRVGEDLENVVSSYVTSREFAARGLLNKTYRDQVELVRFPQVPIFASNDDLAVGHH